MNPKFSFYGWFALVLVVVGGCVSPGEFDPTLVTRYQEAMASRAPQPRQADTGLGYLQPRPPTGPALKMTKDASGKCVITMSLDECIMRALANNLDIKVVSFDPAATHEQMIEAAAQFDFILFGSASWAKQNTLGEFNKKGVLQPNSSVDQETTQFQTGIRQTNIFGGTIAVAPTFTRIVDDLGVYQTRAQTSLQIQMNQPLLRSGGPTYALAQLHIAQVNYKTALGQFRQKVEETLNNVIDSYWALVQARRFLVIEQQLLNSTIETRERIRQRLRIDATMVELKQAEAAVETRRAVLIRAGKNIGDAQDQLSRLLADSQVNVLAKYEIVPSTPPSQVPVKIDPADQLMLSLVYNPVLEQARLAIAGADINVQVAQNQTLPKLDLQGSITPMGQAQDWGRSTRRFFSSGDFVSYNVALLFEYPLGNRAAIAELQRQKFLRLQAITALQNTADQLAVQINERIRQINTAFEEMQAQRAAVSAASAQLQALNDVEQIRGRLTPEFLQLKLQAQETLADSQTAELQALVNYNNAMADLARFAGTILMQHGIDILKMPAAIGTVPWPQEQIAGQRPVGATTTPIRPVSIPAK